MARNREHLEDPLQNSALGIIQSALEIPFKWLCLARLQG